MDTKLQEYVLTDYYKFIDSFIKLWRFFKELGTSHRANGK